MRQLTVRQLVVLLLIGLLFACAGHQPLLAPASFGASWETDGVLVGTTARDQRSMRIAMIVDASQLRVQAVDPVGLPAFGLLQDGSGRISLRSGTPARGVAPRDWLAALQLALWPVAALQAAYSAKGYRLQLDGEQRELWRGHKLLARACSHSFDNRVELRLEFSRSGVVQQLSLHRSTP